MRSPSVAATATVRTGTRRPQIVVLRVVSGWLARQRSRRTLAQLDPHLLHDIGLDAQDAIAEMSKPFWRD